MLIIYHKYLIQSTCRPVYQENINVWGKFTDIVFSCVRVYILFTICYASLDFMKRKSARFTCESTKSSWLEEWYNGAFKLLPYYCNRYEQNLKLFCQYQEEEEAGAAQMGVSLREYRQMKGTTSMGGVDVEAGKKVGYDMPCCMLARLALWVTTQAFALKANF